MIENSGVPGFFMEAFLMISFCIIGIIQVIHTAIIIFYKKFELKRVLLNFFNIGLLVILFVYPNGIIKPKETRKIFLEAFVEGTANCKTSLKLFENNEFKELNICFGIISIEGTYQIKNDTVYFKPEAIPKSQHAYYEYAIIHSRENKLELIRYFEQDSIRKILKIIAYKIP